MAKVSYVGASDKARRVKKLFVGIDGKARKVKKAYVGVGGVARLFFSSGVQPGLYVLGGYTYTLYRFDVNSMTAVSSVSVGSYLDTGSIQGDISTFPAWELIPCGATDSQAFVTKFTTRVTTFIDPVTGAVVKQVTRATTDPLLSGGAKTRIIGTKGSYWYTLNQDTFAEITNAKTSGNYHDLRGSGGWNNIAYITGYENYRDDGDTYCRNHLQCYDITSLGLVRTEVTMYLDYSRVSGKNWIDQDGTYRYLLKTEEQSIYWAYLTKQDANTLAQISKIGGQSGVGSIGSVMNSSDYKRMESLFVVKG